MLPQKQTNNKCYDDRVHNIIIRFHQNYKKDGTLEITEAFETFKRPYNIKICKDLNQIEKLFHKTKTYGTSMSDNLLVYQLL